MSRSVGKPSPSTKTPSSFRRSLGSSSTSGSDSYRIHGKQIFVDRPDEWENVEPSEKEPSQSLELEYVYGFNGTIRNAMYWINDIEYVHAIAASGVVQNVESMSQRHFLKHVEDIESLALHPNKTIVATGQRDVKGETGPYICIWDLVNMEEIARIEYHDRSVMALGFSPDGSKLFSIGRDEAHTLAIWNWEHEQNTPLFSCQLSRDEIFGARTFQSLSDEKTFAITTYGIKHIRVHYITAAEDGTYSFKTLTPSSFEFTKSVQAGYHSCTDNEGKLIVGTQDGNVYIYGGWHKLEKVVKVKENKAVTGVSAVKIADQLHFIAATASEFKIYNAKWEEIDSISLGEGTIVRCFDYNPNTNRIVLGTKLGEILTVELTNHDSSLITTGFSDEVWASAVHPSLPLVVVAAYDKNMSVIDYKTHNCMNIMSVSQAIHSLLFSIDGSILAMGHVDGSISLYNFSGADGQLTLRYNFKPHREKVSCMVFTPDGQRLLSGSYDQSIHVMTVSPPRSLHYLRGHTSSVMSLTISQDSNVLISDGRDYEYLMWDLPAAKSFTYRPKNVLWSQWNNMMGWPVQGIWANTNDGTDINAVSISGQDGDEPKQRVLVVATDLSEVRLYRYPSLSKSADYKRYLGHSSHVTSVRFTPSNLELFTTGGNDMTLMKWKVIY